MKILTIDNKSIIIQDNSFSSKFKKKIKDIIYISETFEILILLFNMVFHDIYTNNLRVHRLAHELHVKNITDLFPMYGKYSIEDYIRFYISDLDYLI